MKTIKDILEALEIKEGIKILFAVESGSRVWRMESADSDYDIRFVYYRPVKEYFRINKPSDVIQVAYDENFNKMPTAEGSTYDLSGFDIMKFSNMLYSSNPTVIGWLQSDIIYYGEKPEALVKYAENNFKPIALYHHNKSMAKQNYLKYIKSEANVSYKKYLYVMRGLVNAKWVVAYEELPPINFIDVIKQLMATDVIDNDVLHELKKIIQLKRCGKEKEQVGGIPVLNKFIEEQLADYSDEPTKKDHSVPNDINKEIQKILGV